MEALLKLLKHFDLDEEVAGDKYEIVHRSLIRFFERKGVPFPDELADATFDRVAQKLDEGEMVANLPAYCHRVAQLILQEYWRHTSNKATTSDETVLAKIVAGDPGETDAKELLSKHLDGCLEKLPTKAALLIIEYYSADHRRLIEARQELADRLGINREALSNRAQRLRDKLEKCIKRCIDGKGEHPFKKLAI